MEDRLRKIESIRKRVETGDPDAIDREHQKCKLTARERIIKLVDPGSFDELELFSRPIPTNLDIDDEAIEGDGVVTGFGRIEGRDICLWAQDATVLGGRMGIIHARKIVRIIEHALNAQVPCIGIYDSEGLRIEDFITTPSNFGYDRIVYLQTMASGIIPQISLIMGPCIGAAAISAQLSDFVFMVRNTSYACVYPPDNAKEIGDAWISTKNTAECDIIAQNDEECLSKARELVGLLPQNNRGKAPYNDTGDDPNRIIDELATLIPIKENKTFNIYPIISLISDNNYFFELKRHWANNLVTGFIRLDGNIVGVLANNPQSLAGCMNYRSAEKMARFVQFCDAFNIPLLWLADTPAFLTSIEEEQGGIIRRGCKCVYWNSNLTVPAMTIYLRKCYAGANLAMMGRGLGGDFGLALTNAEVCGGWPETMVSMAYIKEIEAATDPDAEKEKRLKEFKEQATTTSWQWITVQDHFGPHELRSKLIRFFGALKGKEIDPIPKKHDNITL